MPVPAAIMITGRVGSSGSRNAEEVSRTNA
jgi:hypothetical protein